MSLFYGGSIAVTLTGDWDRLNNTFRYLNTGFREQAVYLNRDQAQRTKDAIGEAVFEMTGKPHGSHIWWVETLELMSNLEVKKAGGGDSAFFVGFGDGMHSVKGNGEPVSYEFIANGLEETHPLIRPTFEKIKGDFLKEWQELVAKATRGGG